MFQDEDIHKKSSFRNSKSAVCLNRSHFEPVELVFQQRLCAGSSLNYSVCALFDFRFLLSLWKFTTWQKRCLVVMYLIFFHDLDLYTWGFEPHHFSFGCQRNLFSSIMPIPNSCPNDRLTMLYRIQHGLVDIHSDSYLQQSDRRTRGEHRLYQERTGSETYSYSFFPRTIRDWNMLPSRTTSAPTLEGFRANLAVCHPVSSY